MYLGGNKMIQSLKNKLLWCSIILESLLFVSSVTAVPQTQGSLVVEQIDEIQSQKQLYTALEALQQPDLSEEDLAALLAGLPSEISTHISSRKVINLNKTKKMKPFRIN